MLQNSSKKYFKRGELIAKEEEEYLKKYGQNNIKDEESQQTNDFHKSNIFVAFDCYIMLLYRNKLR